VLTLPYLRKLNATKDNQQANYKQVAEFFKVDEKELQMNFLSDQIAYKILDEEADIEVS
jgi:hypothetical protein